MVTPSYVTEEITILDDYGQSCRMAIDFLQQGHPHIQAVMDEITTIYLAPSEATRYCKSHLISYLRKFSSNVEIMNPSLFNLRKTSISISDFLWQRISHNQLEYDLLVSAEPLVAWRDPYIAEALGLAGLTDFHAKMLLEAARGRAGYQEWV